MSTHKRRIKWCKRSPWSGKKHRKVSSLNLEKDKTEETTYFLKMIFSSFGFNSPIFKEKFAKVIPQDESLQKKTCLVIPYAGFDTEKTFEREKRGLIEFGFSPDKIKFVRNRLDITAESPDFIYVPGGNPFKLLRSIKEMNLANAIIDCVQNKGATYIGVSAGADIVAKDIAYVLQLEDNNEIINGDYKALGLILEGVLCHYDHYSFATLKACQEVSDGSIITINDDQLLKYENGSFEYVGEE